MAAGSFKSKNITFSPSIFVVRFQHYFFNFQLNELYWEVRQEDLAMLR